MASGGLGRARPWSCPTLGFDQLGCLNCNARKLSPELDGRIVPSIRSTYVLKESDRTTQDARLDLNRRPSRDHQSVRQGEDSMPTDEGGVDVGVQVLCRLKARRRQIASNLGVGPHCQTIVGLPTSVNKKR